MAIVDGVLESYVLQRQPLRSVELKRCALRAGPA